MTSRPIRLPAADFGSKALPILTVASIHGIRVHGGHRPAVAMALSSSPGKSLPEIDDAVEFINRNQIRLV